MLNNENTILAPIPSFPGYKAGADGKIYSIRTCGSGQIDESKTPKCLKSYESTTSKYLYVAVRKDGKTYNRLVSRLVCEAFHGKSPDDYEVSHQNGNRYDNRPENLKWETRIDNINRRILHETDDNGIRNSRALFNLEQIKEIRSLISMGIKLKDIANKFNCDARTIGKIKRGERYSRS